MLICILIFLLSIYLQKNVGYGQAATLKDLTELEIFTELDITCDVKFVKNDVAKQHARVQQHRR